jgi:adenylate cyclase class 2
MSTEIETRFLEVDKDGLILKLQSMNAVDKGEVKLHEIIFYGKDLLWMNENKFIRLRKKNDSVKLTFKSNKEQKVDTAQEIEFTVSSMDDAKSFLEAIGLVQYRVVEKYRHTFILDGVTLDIDTWPKIPVYVELEGDSVESLKGVAHKLGFDWDNRFDPDPRYVFKKYGFDFDNIRTVTFDIFK